ncbi:MAG: hypothetical protein ACHQF2_08380 [Flavobacteriales bacterium]
MGQKGRNFILPFSRITTQEGSRNRNGISWWCFSVGWGVLDSSCTLSVDEVKLMHEQKAEKNCHQDIPVDAFSSVFLPIIFYLKVVSL